MSEDEAALEAEFDVLMRRAGVDMPPNLRAGVVAGFKDLRRLTALLHRPRPAQNESSNIFTLAPFVRDSRA
jgi:hypothetical protein